MKTVENSRIRVTDDMTTNPAHLFGRLLAVYNFAVPRGLAPGLINNAVRLPLSHYATLRRIASPHLTPADIEQVNAIVGDDGFKLPDHLSDVQQLDVWLGYYHQVRLMDDDPAHREPDRESAQSLEDRHGIFAG